jgi:hypothetical protein
MLIQAGQILFRGIIRIHQTAAEAIHRIHQLQSEAARHIHLPQADQAALRTADQEVIQFLQEAPAAVHRPQDLTAVAADHHPLLHIAADLDHEAVAGPTLQVVHHQEVLHREVLHQAVEVAGETRSRIINNITIQLITRHSKY